MLDEILKYWPLILALFVAYAALLKVCWNVRSMRRERVMCENRCSVRVKDVEDRVDDDLKEIKENLKETMKLSQNINLSLTSLTSFLQGKGVTPS